MIHDEDTFITVFQRFLNDSQDGYRNGKIFLETINKFTGEGEEELYIFDSLRKLVEKGDIKIFKQEYFLGSNNLGSSLKIAAMKVAVDPELIKLVMEKSQKYDEIDTDDSE